jgi:hypothetical protein
MAAQLPIGILASKRPLDGSELGVATSLPGGHLTREELWVANAAVQALASERGDFDFCHVQPACMFWGVVEDHPTKKLACGLGAKGLDKAGSEVGAQVVDHQMDASGRPVHGVDQVLREGDEVRLASMIGDLRNPSTAERFRQTRCRSRNERTHSPDAALFPAPSAGSPECRAAVACSSRPCRPRVRSRSRAWRKDPAGRTSAAGTAASIRPRTTSFLATA